MRHRGRVDENQREIASAIRAVGGVVTHLHNVGNGCPDLLVGYRGETYLIEAKGKASLKKFPAAGGLTPEQEAWHRVWVGGRLAVVTDKCEALRAIGAVVEIQGG